MIARSVALTLALTAAAPAFAQDQPPRSDAADNRITLGLGIATMPDYEGSNDNVLTPMPAAIGQVDGYGFNLIGNRISVDVIRNSPGPVWDFQAGPIAVVNLNRNSIKAIDDPRVKALGKLGTAIELGGYVGVGKTGVITSDYDKLSASLSYRHDVSGVHDSGIWTGSVTYFTPLSRKAAVGLFGAVNFAQTKYAQTYFGVSPAQSVVSGLPAFDASGGMKDWNLGAMATMSLTGDLTNGLALVVGGNYRRLTDDFAATPITAIAGSRDQWTAGAGLAYTF
jgi:outer membrane scaffolding protein for murein synthesis (MipA/OmpV family)